MPTTANLSLTYPTPLDPATANLWGATVNDIIIALDAEEATKTINQSFADFTLTRAMLKDCASASYDLGNISGAVTVDYTNGSYQYGTLTGNITSLTINNPPPTGNVAYLTLELTQDGTGSRTIDLTGGTYFAPDGGIDLSTAASAKDKLRLETRNAGTRWDVYINNDLGEIT